MASVKNDYLLDNWINPCNNIKTIIFGGSHGVIFFPVLPIKFFLHEHSARRFAGIRFARGLFNESDDAGDGRHLINIKFVDLLMQLKFTDIRHDLFRSNEKVLAFGRFSMNLKLIPV